MSSGRISARLTAVALALPCLAGTSHAQGSSRPLPAPPPGPSAPGAASPATTASAPAPGSIGYAGGDGTSIERAVVILGAGNSFAGIRAEYSWLQTRFPGYKRRSQALVRHEGKAYDVLEVELPDGRVVRFHFDITAFYGRH